MFYEQGEHSGTLRLNVITARAPREVDASSARQVLRSSGPEIEDLPTGNAMAKGISRSTEQGHAITMYWWKVANIVPPWHARIASFTYTILSSQENSARTLSDLSVLDASVRAAGFSTVLGE